MRNQFLPLLGAAWLLAGCPGEQHHHDECTGFEVMADGSAMLSNLEDGHMAMDGGGHAHHGSDAGTTHIHGTCVKISANAEEASATTSDGAYSVTAQSVRGPLTTDSADNEGLKLTIKKSSGEVVTGLTDVKLKARMPHHNGTVAGGHGPANDFQAQGLSATANGEQYVVDPIDFNMGQYWLFEVSFTAESQVRKAWFAMKVTTGM